MKSISLPLFRRAATLLSLAAGFLFTAALDTAAGVIGDFNADGKSDIFLTNTSTSERAVWLMNGIVISSGLSLGVISTNWLITHSAGPRSGQYWPRVVADVPIGDLRRWPSDAAPHASIRTATPTSGSDLQGEGTPPTSDSSLHAPTAVTPT